MKQFLSTLALVTIAIFSATAQQTALQNFIDKYRQDKVFTYAFLSKNMFDVALGSEVADNDWKKLHNLVRNIGSLSILAADSLDYGSALYKEALSALPVSEFDEIIAVQDGKEKVKIWSRDENDVVTDLVVLAVGNQAFLLISFSGNLVLENLTDLLGLLDVNEAQSLAKTSEALSASFDISPNPSRGVFTLQYHDQGDAPIQLSILDQSGRHLQTLNLSENTTQEITLATLPVGVYWVQVRSKLGKIGVRQIHLIR